MKRGLGIVLVLLLATLLQQYLVTGFGGGKGGRGAQGAGQKAGETGKSTTHTVTKTASSSSSSSSKDSSSSSDSSAELKDAKSAVGFFNQERAKSMPGAAPLAMDEKLNKQADKCANYYADKQKVDYTCPYTSGAGEVAYGSKETFDMRKLTGMSLASMMTDAKDFDYSKPNFAKDIVTMMMWPGCKKMGFGKASKKGFTSAVVLLYPIPKKS